MSLLSGRDLRSRSARKRTGEPHCPDRGGCASASGTPLKAKLRVGFSTKAQEVNAVRRRQDVRCCPIGLTYPSGPGYPTRKGGATRVEEVVSIGLQRMQTLPLQSRHELAVHKPVPHNSLTSGMLQSGERNLIQGASQLAGAQDVGNCTTPVASPKGLREGCQQDIERTGLVDFSKTAGRSSPLRQLTPAG